MPESEAEQLKDLMGFAKKHCPNVSSINIGVNPAGLKTWTFTFDWTTKEGNRKLHHATIDEWEVRDTIDGSRMHFYQAITTLLRDVRLIRYMVTPYIGPGSTVYKLKRRIRIRRSTNGE